MNLRKLVIDEYASTGKISSLKEVGHRAGLSDMEVNDSLAATLPLSSLGGLTPEQALEVVDAIGTGVIFSKDIEIRLHDFRETRVVAYEKRAGPRD
ncbi:MAG: hypothetical protein ACREXS_18480 [Gammaproteobacteria bacterium]